MRFQHLSSKIKNVCLYFLCTEGRSLSAHPFAASHAWGRPGGGCACMCGSLNNRSPVVVTQHNPLPLEIAIYASIAFGKCMHVPDPHQSAAHTDSCPCQPLPTPTAAHSDRGPCQPLCMQVFFKPAEAQAIISALPGSPSHSLYSRANSARQQGLEAGQTPRPVAYAPHAPPPPRGSFERGMGTGFSSLNDSNMVLQHVAMSHTEEHGPSPFRQVWPTHTIVRARHFNLLHLQTC